MLFTSKWTITQLNVLAVNICFQQKNILETYMVCEVKKWSFVS